MSASTSQFGPLLREWRQRRRVTQLDLALDANISTRHISFLETGRAQPSREMVLRLAEQLKIPIRDRNVMLTSAGYASVYQERHLDDPALAVARDAIDLVIHGHSPYPAIAVDRHWTLVSMNDAVTPLLAGVSETLLRPPANVMRIALHPDGLAPRIANLGEWRHHLLDRLRHQIEAAADPGLITLRDELMAYPVPDIPPRTRTKRDYAGLVVPFELVTEYGLLAMFSTTTVSGTPLDVTLSELAMECFYPADPATAEILRHLRDRRREAS